MLQKIAKILGGDPNRREIERFAEVAQEINALELEYEKLSDAALAAKTEEFRQRLADGETLDDLLVEAFAAVREASKRTIGLRHYDVQLIGGMVLHGLYHKEGMIAEMRTGEGKTLVATLPLYLNALPAKGVHLITVNDYLARRDARWMAPIYNLLGLSVGVLQMAARTENGRKAFVVDQEKESPFEDQHQLVLVDRADAYRCDITYGTNSEFGFDYLRDNLTNRLDDRVQRGHHYAIVDEVDNVLIDEARTPLIISGPASDETEWYVKMAQVVRALNPEDYEINEKDRTVTLTEVGDAHVEQLLNLPLRDPDRPEDITPEQARLLGYLEQALKAQFLYRRNKEYLVQGGKVVIVDDFTGRLMPGRRWSEGLHQAVEAKEGVKVEPENVTYATITIQNYFRMYEKLAGMTGTASTEAEEFSKIYKLDVLPIPTNLEYQAFGKEAALVEVNDKDEEGYRYTYYSRPERKDTPVFYKRKDYPDVVYRTEEAKLRAILFEIVRYHVIGRPQLVGTTSVEHSDRLSDRLRAEPIRRMMQAFLIRQAWLRFHNRQESETAIEELKFLNKPVDQLDMGELRRFARSINLNSLNLEDDENLNQLLGLLNLNSEHKDRLLKVIQAGVAHNVLNARKHDEESRIIAEAGAFGAVTIATNMAGRGVDIKLGGELSGEVYADATRVLTRAGIDPYNMTSEQIYQALKRVPAEDQGIYEEAVQAYIEWFENLLRVRALGGLHVIGSERHEARRIDNQLRGRAARQGDPGSSRFYLSLDDELMRLFGGVQVEGLMRRLNVDESLPIESNIVGRLVEQSQTRVEGSNFDVRKHLLEYDDVLNSQRKRIYAQRDRVFTKEDLTEDVEDMLVADLANRVPNALADPQGPWKLLGYLEEIQPLLNYEGIVYPTYTMRLLVNDLVGRLPGKTGSPEQLRSALLGIAESALDAERDYLLHSTQELIDKLEEATERQREERLEALDTFVEGLSLRGEEEGAPPLKPQEAGNELASLVRIPLRLSIDQMRGVMEGDEDAIDTVRGQVDDYLSGLNAARITSAVKRRLPDATIKASDLQGKDWADLTDAVLDQVEVVFKQRKTVLLGENGQIERDLQAALEKLTEPGLGERELIGLLQVMAQGTRISFDSAHRRTSERYMRLHYPFLAARLLENREPDDVRQDVLEHLQGAEKALGLALGASEWNRLRAANVTLGQFDDSMQAKFADRLGSAYSELAQTPLADFEEENRRAAAEILGKRLQNETYRQLLLQVISQSWVEYLTKVDALRASIGLEAFAQRDPLVQYKSQASEMFRQLLDEIRSGVVTNMFLTRPARQAMAASAASTASPVAAGGDDGGAPAEQAVAEGAPPQAQPPQGSGSSKRRKRKRH